MIHATRTQLHRTLCPLLRDQTGSSALEYVMLLALVTLGTTSVLGGAANFFLSLFQNMISSVNALWPS